MLSYRSGNWPEVTRNYLARATRMIEGTSDGEITWDWMPAENIINWPSRRRGTR